ncbi:MAG: excinuclease ABC subunit UvrC [Campylobacterales bacterium]|nr:excinuclease ABC subunit UvrC [Campylobacterales bacterium]NQY22088.1 excinuclease ABC subunit UvrC [Campylobacteraceae bacterium]
MNLEEKLKQLPNDAGVYQYFNKEGKLLYIGKAKNLKNRVKSYFRFTPNLGPADKLGPRIFKMISEVEFLEWIIAPSEHDALILENSLIKQLKPKYNILLRDDKTYPYLYIDNSELFPRIEITRRVYKDKNIKYFGPYSTGARDILDSIYEIVPLVQKKSCLKGKEACLFHQIKKCHAPCVGKITQADYALLVKDALSYVYNKKKLVAKLQIVMEKYSEDFRFEEAMKIRDRIKTIEKSEIKTSMDLATTENLDLFAIKAGIKRAVIVRLFIRDGKLASSSYDFIKLNFLEDNSALDLSEAYSRAIINYYDNEIPILPKEILLAQEIEDKDYIEEFLYKKFSKKILLTTPKKDKKLKLIEIALNNCSELLRLDENTNSSTIYKEIQKLFSLSCEPFRIEAYDNSHMMGQATVGAMIVWNNGLEKKDYRHYNLEAKDEYAQMKEVLLRRIDSFEKNQAPDLWVIDGGSTLLKLAHLLIDSHGVNLDVIAISKEKIDAKSHRAKGSAHDILHYRINGEYIELKLKPSDQRLQFMQRLRDEAHRFVISFHKKQKRAEDKQVSLLQIKGIGQAKLKKLLLYFGTFEEIKTASVDKLEAILNKKDSILIHNYFKDKI